MGKELGAQAVWCQSGRASDGVSDPKGCWLPEEASREACRLVQSAGLHYIDRIYIVDAVERLVVDK